MSRTQDEDGKEKEKNTHDCVHTHLRASSLFIIGSVSMAHQQY